MALPTGLAAQLGIAEETTYGTPVTVTRFYEFVDESLKLEIARLESAGLRAGNRVQRSDRWAAGSKTVAGDINMEIGTRSFALWLKHMLGAIAITTPAGGTLSRDHTATPSAIGSQLPTGLTVQVGKPDNAGTVRAFTYHGCMIPSWSIRGEVDQLAKLRVSIAGEDEETAIALAAASYPTGLKLLTFVHGSLTIAAGSVEVRSAELNGDNGLKIDRRKLGSQLIKRPTESAMAVFNGTLDAYWDDLTLYNRFINGTEAALVLAFTHQTAIEGALFPMLQITANVRFDGETPQVDGPDELEQPLAYKCVSADGTPGSALTIVYRTEDTVS